jgi:hypothetical protein
MKTITQAELESRCMESRNSGQRRAGDQGSRELQRGVRWSLAGITQTVSAYGRLKGMHRISICTALTPTAYSVAPRRWIRSFGSQVAHPNLNFQLVQYSRPTVASWVQLAFSSAITNPFWYLTML